MIKRSYLLHNLPLVDQRRLLAFGTAAFPHSFKLGGGDPHRNTITLASLPFSGRSLHHHASRQVRVSRQAFELASNCLSGQNKARCGYVIAILQEATNTPERWAEFLMAVGGPHVPPLSISVPARRKVQLDIRAGGVVLAGRHPTALRPQGGGHRPRHSLEVTEELLVIPEWPQKRYLLRTEVLRWLEQSGACHMPALPWCDCFAQHKYALHEVLTGQTRCNLEISKASGALMCGTTRGSHAFAHQQHKH